MREDDIESRPAQLVLSDGTIFEGQSFGAPLSTAGEVVFNTGMVGYPESLTDPSYAGQILVLTYPLIGNYGVPNDDLDAHGLPLHFESSKIHVKCVVISNYSQQASHYLCNRTLHEWLQEHGITGIYGVDTRAITKHIRDYGSILGKVIVDGSTPDSALPFDDPNKVNLAAMVSRTEKQVFTPKVDMCNEFEKLGMSSPRKNRRDSDGCSVMNANCHIVAVDCGIKNNIIRYLVDGLGVKLTVVPWDYDFTEDEFDGLFLSNGPGDPTMCTQTIEHLQKMMKTRKDVPIFGICLGNQLLALAAGGSTYKMKFGNRGMNQPCIDLRTTRCYITPQNHGFAVDKNSLGNNWTELFVNANDGTNEGITHKSRPWFSVQFHPEACGGPTDTAFLFTHFIHAIQNPSSLPVTTVPFKMPETYRKVLVLGSGGLSIGQAGEFDYSGSQAIKALKECGVQSVLVNPNIATVQTTAGLADKVYFLPVTPTFIEEVIKKEKPDGLFCTFGGQTALNCAVAMHDAGILDKYNIKVLGTPIESIVMTEDRELFAAAVAECGYQVAESKCCTTMDEVVKAAEQIGYPVLIRAAFALGGLGSGFAHDKNELLDLATKAFTASPQVIIDKSLRGWKELEYEVVRDWNDNCITVCNMENFDPMGIHTGDSIVVAPSQTLTNSEYYRLRECAIRMIRHIGVVGECNIQYAVDPLSHEFRIIEVNARLSRSSALASKATGYPLAYVAAKLALGQTLPVLRNSVTKCTTACFEPALDYCVVKVPRWDLKKFVTVDQELGSCMKSVGEVMAIGKRFEEVFQKGLRMADDAGQGFVGSRYDLEFEFKPSDRTLEQELARPTPMRPWAIAKAFELGQSVDEVFKLSKIDKWFLCKLYNIHRHAEVLRKTNYFELKNDPKFLREIKACGFSDPQIAMLLTGVEKDNAPSPSRSIRQTMGESSDPVERGYRGGSVTAEHVRQMRYECNVHPVIKQIDTLAAEFPAQTNYLYLTYDGIEHDVQPCAIDFGVKKPISTGDENLLVDRDLSPRVDRTSGSARFSMDDASGYSAANRLDPTAPLAEISSSGNSLRLPTPVPRAGLGSAIVPGGATNKAVGTFVVLGCGPYRIGSSVEFDWCCVSAIRTMRAVGRTAIVINCNPETVSTDYDESDRLYFEELNHETVRFICEYERAEGTVISVGGQIPQNLSLGLAKCGVPILGTTVESIDMAENRYKFSRMCDSLKIDQPDWSEFTSFDEATRFCDKVGFPTLVRPSYVLSGAAMRVINTRDELDRFLRTAAVVSPDHPVVISKYIQGAKEVEMDAVGCGGEVVNYAISEHIENAGVHSGDATLLLPAQKLYVETHRRVKKISQKICRALRISGPFNIQFLCKNNEVKVIECNLRASRTFPFISKTFNVNFIEIATKVMLKVIAHSIFFIFHF